MAQDWVLKPRPLVRLTAHHVELLDAFRDEGEDDAHALRRALEVAAQVSVLPETVIVSYRKPPVFKEWMKYPPLSPIDADQRGRRLLAQGFELMIEHVPG